MGNISRRRISVTSVLVLAFLAVFLALAARTSSVGAANGDAVAPITFSEDCESGIGVGIAFDGVNLWYSCYNSATDLYRANANTGVVNASYSIADGLGALAYDGDRNAIWAGWGGSNTGDVYLIQLDAGKNVTGSMVKFTTLEPVVFGLDDGLAIDTFTDTLYISDDGSTTIHHFDTMGNHLDDFPWGGSGCYNSGLAIGGDLLYEGSNGCNHVWVVNKVTKAASFDFPTTVVTVRDEDLECDNVTFAPVEVMWSMEAYDVNFSAANHRTAVAYEIPSGSCKFGGGKPPLPPAPVPVPSLNQWGLVAAAGLFAVVFLVVLRRRVHPGQTR